MKRLILLLMTALICTTTFGQWVPATTAETTYSTVFANSNGPRYNVGTDTRSAFASSPHSGAYANYLNVTVSDYQIAADGRSMFWESSHGTNGQHNLPYDAIDPDVVMVEGTSPLSVWAIVVYYSENAANPGTPGYYMSCSEFTASPFVFNPFSGPVLIDTFTPAPGFLPCINIDSDNRGNYAIVYQEIGGIESRTATMTGLFPPSPANPITISNAKRPDIAINVLSSLDNVKIVSLRNGRNRYQIHSRQMGPTLSGSYLSPVMPTLNWPRIAAPTTLSTNFAITMMQRQTSPLRRNILFNTFSGLTPSGIITINNGTAASYPANISNFSNVFPAISYHSSGGNELISVVWHGRRVNGSPNLNHSFIGLDIIPSSLIPTVPNGYFDVSYLTTTRNNRATIGVSGRYTDWCKTTAFAYGTNNTTPTELVWKYAPSSAPSWKTTPNPDKGNAIDKIDKALIKVYPNPTSNIINIDITKNTNGYGYEVYNQNGQAVIKNVTNEDKLSVSVTNLASGAYYIKLLNKDTKEVSGFKFLKE